MKPFRVPTDRRHPLASGMFTLAVAAALAASVCFPLAAQTTAAAPASAAAAKPATPKATAAKQPIFPTPEAGFEALVAALRANDARQLAVLLGPGHQRIIDSGDNAADRAAWAKFVAEYDAQHAVQREGSTKAMLVTGKNEWPMPVPLVTHDNGWAFDATAGEDEIVARRIGRNELDTIQVCLAFIDMQREYAEADRNGDGLLEYAGRFISSPGKKDGLYWPTQPGEPESPAGPRLAEADPRLKQATTRPTPYHGYYYRIVTAQGKNAPGGARNYLANGKLIGGVALVAYPATYLNSGVKTFACNMDGIVYEKDLGPATAKTVQKIGAYDPDPSWTQTK